MCDNRASRSFGGEKLSRHRVRVQADGQITLPAEVRRHLDLKPGDELTVEETAEGITLTPCVRGEYQYTVPYVPLDLPEPTPEQLARRRELFDRIMENRKHRNIAPLTAVDLVRLSRSDDFWYGPESEPEH